jgi:transcriptional regulator with PAS, ATPase and Fis domain
MNFDWKLVFDALDDLAMILDREHRILAVNSAVEKISGLREEELVGRNCYEIFHSTNQPPEGCPRDKLIKSCGSETVMEMEGIGGTYLVTVAPIVDEDSDITKAKRVEKQIQEQIKLEEKYAKEMKFYHGNDYNLSAVEVNQESLSSLPVIEPDYDFNMDDAYSDIQ